MHSTERRQRQADESAAGRELAESPGMARRVLTTANRKRALCTAVLADPRLCVACLRLPPSNLDRQSEIVARRLPLLLGPRARAVSVVGRIKRGVRKKEFRAARRARSLVS